jgi:hypothetical protein
MQFRGISVAFPENRSNRINSNCRQNVHKLNVKEVEIMVAILYNGPIPVVARSKVCVGGRSLSGIVSSNPAGGMDVCLL